MSSINLTFKNLFQELYFQISGSSYFSSFSAEKYNIVIRPDILKVSIINVTASDIGSYWIDNWIGTYTIMLNISDSSCPSSQIGQVCAIVGSSPILKFIHNEQIFYSRYYFFGRLRTTRRVSNFTRHTDIQIYNVTREDEGLYILHEIDSNNSYSRIALHVAKSNGSTKAIGDNQTVSYSFIPNRTDHLTKLKCVDSKHSSIMIEVELTIRYAPVIKGRYTNETIKCDCIGVPATYRVYRLDQISKYGELVRSLNLSSQTINIKMDYFSYQMNGLYKCIVSNGVPNINGHFLQIWSTHVKYEGPPVFASENKYLKTGTVGLSMTMSFYIYSNPDVEEIVIENTGQKPTKSKKFKHNNLFDFTLLYSEFNNIVGIEGYEIVVESEVLDIDDFQVYRITVKNRLGESSYHFAIIDCDLFINITISEIQPCSKNNWRYFVVFCSIAVVLFVYLAITHVLVFAKHVKTRFQRSHNVDDEHNYHTYDEIGTISYHAVSNLRSSDTIANHGLNLTEQHGVGISIAASLQSTDDNIAELNDDFREDDLEQHDVTEIQGENVSLSFGTTNISNTDVSRLPPLIILSMGNVRGYQQTNENTDSETQSDQQSQTSNDPTSESSQNMVGNSDDEYENPYQTVLNDHRSNHQYVQITRERSNSISSSANLHLTDANTTELNANFLEDITGLQVRRITMSVKDRDFSRTDSTSSTIIPSMQNIVNSNQTNESSTSDDSDSDSSTNIMEGNFGDGYEHPYQTVSQNHPESHPYIKIIRERHSSISSTGSTESEGQIVGTDSTKKEDYINLQF
ncbi:unnamed protein product [Mytilus edulis]|uniref:Ig-like domain-containing protein n=1 Tax=Mytilus edulis TaxID=6550 RepID=A0A8S3S522_MYTED|nr:unnamed protein product [Mytilus edulis]